MFIAASLAAAAILPAIARDRSAETSVAQLSGNTVLFHTDYAYCVPSFTYSGKADIIEWMPTQNTSIAAICAIR